MGQSNRLGGAQKNNGAGEWAVSRILFRRCVTAPAVAAIYLGRPLPSDSEQPTRGLSPCRLRQNSFDYGGRVGEWNGPFLAPYLALLPVGFAVPRLSPGGRCALTAPFHPCLSLACGEAIGGLLSVALSLVSRPVAVNDHRALVEFGLSSRPIPGHPRTIGRAAALPTRRLRKDYTSVPADWPA